jgi:DNA-binding NarL/FixJ family response regulator
MMQCIRVLIADDHTMFRAALRTYLENKQGYEVVGEAANGEEAVVRATDLKPDVLLMDINMTPLNGIEATRRILKTNPDIGVVVITSYETNELVFAAMRAGARGYILKRTGDYEEMDRVIRAVATGEAHFGPEIAKRLIAFFSSLQSNSAQAIPDLSNHEFRVLDLLAQGHNRSDIAEQEYLDSSQTVSDDVTNLMDKLQNVDRALEQDVDYRTILEGRWRHLSERVNALEQALDIETDPLTKLKYEEQLRTVEARRENVGQELRIVEERLQT